MLPANDASWVAAAILPAFPLACPSAPAGSNIIVTPYVAHALVNAFFAFSDAASSRNANLA